MSSKKPTPKNTPPPSSRSLILVILLLLIALAIFYAGRLINESGRRQPTAEPRVAPPTAPPVKISAYSGIIKELKTESFILLAAARNNFYLKQDQEIEIKITPATKIQTIAKPKSLTPAERAEFEKTGILKAIIQEIPFSELKAGQKVFVKSAGENIYGQKEFSAQLVSVRKE